jgi:flagellar protein FlbT
MALKITLKPNEKMIVGGAVVTNANSRKTNLVIENNVPVLRQKDILSEKDATSVCTQIYFLIQLMYMDEENLNIHQQTYWDLVYKLLNAVPRLTGHINRINENILSSRYYQALKMANVLIEYEQEILKNAKTDPIT